MRQKARLNAVCHLLKRLIKMGQAPGVCRSDKNDVMAGLLHDLNVIVKCAIRK